MDYFQAIIYGIVQGVAEFLPISSTAHLVLLPKLFGWTELSNTFDVALHLGTSVAVIVFFFKEWVKLIKAGFTKPKSTDGKLFWFIAIACIPGALAGILLDKYMTFFESPLLIGIMLIVMGLLLYVFDKVSKKTFELEEIGLKRSILVGLAQILAIIPGVSRSGVTMTAGRALGITRDGIARFTFLISTPLILGDALYHVKDIANVPIEPAPFVVAILTAAITGILAIKFLLNYIRTKGFGIFAIYRFVFGGLIIVLALLNIIR